MEILKSVKIRRNKINLRDILSKNIKYYRKKARMTQSVLAKKSGLSIQMIKNLEVKRTFGTDRSIQNIAKALKIKAWKLFIPLIKTI
jgi:transcriptional regulator with XRE-family HTH domain